MKYRQLSFPIIEFVFLTFISLHLRNSWILLNIHFLFISYPTCIDFGYLLFLYYITTNVYSKPINFYGFKMCKNRKKLWIINKIYYDDPIKIYKYKILKYFIFWKASYLHDNTNNTHVGLKHLYNKASKSSREINF